MADIDIVDKLLDLQKQATTEQSHYYTANLITKAIQEIIALRQMIAALTGKEEV